MNGGNIFAFTLEVVPRVVDDVLRKNDLAPENVGLYIMHQANKFMLEALRRKMRIPEGKFFVDLEEIGNTVSSTIPIALKDALDADKISRNSRVVAAGFGVGLSWGANVLYF